LVAVEHVTVTGAGGSDGAAIRAELDAVARGMTTLDLNPAKLRAAVSRFEEVTGLRVSAQFPHGLVIRVVERLPVAAVRMLGREVAVSDDGVLLPDVALSGPLPLIALAEPPSGNRLQGSWAPGAARLLGAAPRRLLSRLAEVMTVTGHGLVVQIRNGPSVYFGGGTELRQKWAAVMAVLSDPGSAGASYIDVTDPGHPAAGGSGPATASAASATASTISGTPTTASTTSSAASTTASGTTSSGTPTGG
jgi:cell division protein FtsQ